MQSGRLLRTAAQSAARLYSARTASRYGNGSLLVRRSLCANTAPAPKRPPSTNGQKVSSAESVAEAARVGESGGTAEASQVADAAKTAGEATSAAGAEKGSTKIPDVSSTSLGLEDPMVNDPLKWRKFAYKYAGAVLLFLVSYKSLNWYVERLEADGKRKRQELEENKTIIQGINGGENVQAATSPTPSSVTANQTADVAGLGTALPTGEEEQLPAMRIFDPVKEEEPQSVSELDELYVYKIELQAKLRDLDSQTRTREIDAEKREIETDLKLLDKDIAELEALKRKS